jgi:hypothetical protein
MLPPLGLGAMLPVACRRCIHLPNWGSPRTNRPPRAATHPIQLRPQLARVTPRSMASASIRPPKPNQCPPDFNYLSLPGNPDSTQPKSALVVARLSVRFGSMLSKKGLRTSPNSDSDDCSRCVPMCTACPKPACRRAAKAKGCRRSNSIRRAGNQIRSSIIVPAVTGCVFVSKIKSPSPPPPGPRWGFSFLGTSNRDPGEQFCTDGYCPGVQARTAGHGRVFMSEIRSVLGIR